MGVYSFSGADVPVYGICWIGDDGNIWQDTLLLRWDDFFIGLEGSFCGECVFPGSRGVGDGEKGIGCCGGCRCCGSERGEWNWEKGMGGSDRFPFPSSLFPIS